MKLTRKIRNITIFACLTLAVIALIGSFFKTMQTSNPTKYSLQNMINKMASLNRTNYELSINSFVNSWVNQSYEHQEEDASFDAISSLPPIFDNNAIIIDKRVAEEVSKKVRVFCWIPSRNIHRDTRLKAVNSTWARRCDKVMYFMTSPTFQSSDVVDVPIVDTRKTLTDKTVYAHTYIYDHYLEQYDWFLKADDDTYVIMENLKFLLSKFSPEIPGYIGCQFKHFSPQGYMSGGASYAFNSLGLKAIVEQGYRIPARCRLTGGAEDIETGRCAFKAGVRTLDQLDVKGKQTFFPSNVYSNVLGPIPDWVASYSRTIPSKANLSCCSPLLVSFHYTGPKLMYTMEFFLYRVVVHGRREVITKADGMFGGKEAPDMPIEYRRRAYPGERLEDYYKNDWRKKNTTVYINPNQA